MFAPDGSRARILVKLKLPLTTKQEQVLDYITERIQGGLPPTRAEISKYLECRSDNTSEGYLKALEKKGYIRITKGISRGIELCA